MTSERVHAPNFGEIADIFDRIRPGYPVELATDVLAYTGIAGVEALEIGAGTGKATSAFRQLGVRVTAIEPDPAMAALLAVRQPDVPIVASSFEDYEPVAPVELLYCAQAWHWTDPDRRWDRAAAALAVGGTIALFWNSDRLLTPQARAIFHAALSTHAPRLLFLLEDEGGDDDLADSWPATDLAELPTFGDLDTRLYQWQRTLCGEDYLAYLSTRSTFRMLPPASREAIFSEVADRLPEKVDLAVETALYLARRR